MNKLYRSIAAFLLSCLLLILTACSSGSAKNASPTPSPVPESVERTETVNIPESVLDRLDLDIAALSRRLKLYNVTENIDGSCTVSMTEEEKALILPALRSALDSEIAALPESGIWPFLIKAEINADGTKATLHTTEELYDPVRDRTVAEAIFLPALLYAAFTREDAENFTLKIHVMDGSRLLDSYTYPLPEPTPAAE